MQDSSAPGFIAATANKEGASMVEDEKVETAATECLLGDCGSERTLKHICFHTVIKKKNMGCKWHIK